MRNQVIMGVLKNSGLSRFVNLDYVKDSDRPVPASFEAFMRSGDNTLPDYTGNLSDYECFVIRQDSEIDEVFADTAALFPSETYFYVEIEKDGTFVL